MCECVCVCVIHLCASRLSINTVFDVLDNVRVDHVFVHLFGCVCVSM